MYILKKKIFISIIFLISNLEEFRSEKSAWDKNGKTWARSNWIKSLNSICLSYTYCRIFDVRKIFLLQHVELTHS